MPLVLALKASARLNKHKGFHILRRPHFSNDADHQLSWSIYGGEGLVGVACIIPQLCPLRQRKQQLTLAIALQPRLLTTLTLPYTRQAMHHSQCRSYPST